MPATGVIEMNLFTKREAEALAKHDRSYYAKKVARNFYCVWDAKSDHVVEFDQATIDKVSTGPLIIFTSI
jgi:hypothetical protein